MALIRPVAEKEGTAGPRRDRLFGSELRLVAVIVVSSVAAVSCGRGPPPNSSSSSPPVEASPADTSASPVPSVGPFVGTGIVGRWRFDAITGVSPDELPKDALRDNRDDLVIAADGLFRWGGWTGTVTGAGTDFLLDITAPTALRKRFDFSGAAIVVLRAGRTLKIWLPDLGTDRDVDMGSAGEDIDSPDLAFVRPSPG
jgi:hypothetical protein